MTQERRIRRMDKLNWVLESYKEPTLITKGRHQGKMSKGKWEIEGYYGKLQDLPVRYLQLYLSGSYNDVQKFLTAIKDAEQAILQEIERWAANGD